jgi:hypothetical protein
VTLGPRFQDQALELGRRLVPDLERARAAVAARAAAMAARRQARRSRVTRLGGALALLLAIGLAIGQAQPWRGAGSPRTALVQTPSVEAALPDAAVPRLVSSGPILTALPSSARQCPVEDLSVEVAFDHDRYAAGDNAVVSVVLLNHSPFACAASTDRCASAIRALDSGGHTIYSSAQERRHLCTDPRAQPDPVAVMLPPGRTAVLSFSWVQPLPGRYTVTGEWGGISVASLPRHVSVG